MGQIKKFPLSVRLRVTQILEKYSVTTRCPGPSCKLNSIPYFLPIHKQQRFFFFKTLRGTDCAE